MAGSYKPTSGDLEYRNAVRDEELPLFDEARLLRGVSHEYLAVLAHDNSAPECAGYKAMLDAEISRRGFAVARRANQIAITSAVIACISLAYSLLS